jgi:hypothetical protein
MKTGVMPVGHLNIEQVRQILVMATTPPPLRGARPWRFQCTPGAIELYADIDEGPERREQLLSCGVALLNLRLAIKAHGSHPDVRLLPTAGRPDLLAVVRPRGHEPVSPVDRALADAIPARRGNRSPFTAAAVTAEVQRELRRAAEIERSWLATVEPEQVPLLREIMDRAAPEVGDGADFDVQPDRLLVVVGSLHDTNLALLQAGQAMQRVLLTATASGLSSTLWSAVMGQPGPRRELRQLLGGGLWPQVMLRLGHGAPVAPFTPVRLEDVVTSDEHPFSAGLR